MYALRSDTCPYVKVGRSNTLPYRRLRELNASANYGPIGPWEIVTYIEVQDAVAVEAFLHKAIREKLAGDYATCKELFSIAPSDALELFSRIPGAEISGFDKIVRLASTANLTNYLRRIFRLSGLDRMLAHQGTWALSLFPVTAGGR